VEDAKHTAGPRYYVQAANGCFQVRDNQTQRFVRSFYREAEAKRHAKDLNAAITKATGEATPQ